MSEKQIYHLTDEYCCFIIGINVCHRFVVKFISKPPLRMWLSSRQQPQAKQPSCNLQIEVATTLGKAGIISAFIAIVA